MAAQQVPWRSSGKHVDKSKMGMLLTKVIEQNKNLQYILKDINNSVPFVTLIPK